MAQTKSLRQKQEEREHQILGPFASYADESGGRDREEPQCDIRTDFQRDRDRILHCKAFRRLKQKTQVFLAPEGDHYRTRLTHTLEVAQNARTIARALLLNEDLTEAIPAYICILAMPIFYSIAEGISMGVISYVVINLITGKAKEKKISALMYVLAVLFILKYIFL